MWYTTKELADLLGVSERTIQRRAKKGEWETRMEPGHGGNGEVYKIFYDPKLSDTINDISTTHQRHVNDMNSATQTQRHSTTPPDTIADTLDKPLSHVPKQGLRNENVELGLREKGESVKAAERKIELFRTSLDCTPYAEMPDEYLREAFLKGKMCEEYLSNNNIESKKERMKILLKLFNHRMYLSELEDITGSISERTFRRWLKKYIEAGRDYRVLVRKYIHHYRGRSIPEDIQNRLLRELRHPNRIAIGTAILNVQDHYRIAGKEIDVSERTMRRWIDDWKVQNPHLWTISREGLKAYDEKINKTILRDLNLLEVGDVWVADGHDLSFDIIDPYDQKPRRMTLIVWFDMRSRMPVGCAINSTEDSQCIALALRNAILFTGYRPKFVYLDNGKAFKSKIFVSKPADHDLENELGGYFYRLGISPHFAIPYNAKAKIVERFFRTVQDQYERLVPSFRGRNIEDKPATLYRNEKWMQKLYERKPLTMDEFKLTFSFWVMELYAQHEHEGLGGQKPINVLRSAEIEDYLKVEPSELNHLMLCTKRRKILNNGVKHNKLWYWAEEMVTHVGQICMIRYDNFNINSILVYDEKDNYICQARVRKLQHPLVHLTGDIETKRDLEREIKQIRRIKKQHKKATKEFMQQVEGDQLIPDKSVGALFNDIPLISEEGESEKAIKREKKEAKLREFFNNPASTDYAEASEKDEKNAEELRRLFTTENTEKKDEKENKTNIDLHKLYEHVGLKEK